MIISIENTKNMKNDNFILLGDIHLGVKNDDPWMENNILELFIFLCKYAKENNIRTLLQAGDWFDVRRGISQRTMEFFRAEIVPLLEDAFDDVYVDVGNHDMHLKDFITPNSCREVLSQYKVFHVIEEPTTVEIGGKTIDIIPWICKSNKLEISRFIANSTSDYCMGHFEINGALFYKGMVATGCEDPEFLEKYKAVYSGHFHTISTIGNVRYLGTPYTITLGDANDPRGFWVYDQDATDIEFIENPLMHHERIYFDADTWSHTAEDLVDLYTNKTVKLVIEKSHSDTNKKLSVDKVLDDMERICHEFKHEYTEAFETTEETQDTDEHKSASQIIDEQIDAQEETDEVKERVKKIFKGLLAEAVSQE